MCAITSPVVLADHDAGDPAWRYQILIDCMPMWDPLDKRTETWNGKNLHSEPAEIGLLFWETWGAPAGETDLVSGIHVQRWRWEYECTHPAPPPTPGSAGTSSGSSGGGSSGGTGGGASNRGSGSSGGGGGGGGGSSSSTKDQREPSVPESEPPSNPDPKPQSNPDPEPETVPESEPPSIPTIEPGCFQDGR